MVRWTSDFCATSIPPNHPVVLELTALSGQDASSILENAMASKDPRIPLPKSWPVHVRAAILHVIALAQFATALTRSWAANSINARIRLKAERHQALEEVSRLREESGSRTPARERSIHVDVHIIRQQNDWQSWS